jgi:hypothetical protein
MKNLYPATLLLQAAVSAQAAERVEPLSTGWICADFINECSAGLDQLGFDGAQSIQTKNLVPVTERVVA